MTDDDGQTQHSSISATVGY